MTTPVLGQTILIKTQASPLRTVPAIVSLVTDDDTVNADGLLDTSDDWPEGPPVTHPCFFFGGITRGTGVGQWQESAIGVTGPSGATGLTGSVGATGPGALITGVSQRSYTPAAAGSLGPVVQPSTTHDVKITASWKIDNSLSLTGGSGATVVLFSDAANPPTTEVLRLAASSTGTLTIGLALNTSTTVPGTFRIRAADRYAWKITNDTGTPTTTLVGGIVTEQVLG